MENVKVISRSWGWALKWIGTPIPKWIMSNDGTFGWYKKRKTHFPAPLATTNKPPPHSNEKTAKTQTENRDKPGCMVIVPQPEE